MGYAFILAQCANCNRPISCNPRRVPSIRVNGVKEPICKVCFDKWNEIHRTSKGLEPVPLHEDAYEPIDEREL